MKNFKKLFAIIFTVAVVVFGVLVMIDERDIFQMMKDLKFDGGLNTSTSILLILILITDVFLIALPAIGFVLVLTDKFDPFKAIVDSALVVLAKFLISIFGFILLLLFAMPNAQDAGEFIKEFMFNKDVLGIIPTLVFVAAFAFLMIAKVSNFEGTLARAVLATIGSGLAIFGLVFYFINGGADSFFGGMGQDPDWLTIMGLVVGIACFAGIVVYSFLPQTREFKTESEPAQE